MLLFEWTIGLLLGAVLLAGVARRLAVPYPALLAIAGAVLAFLPFAPEITIEPELALALFVAPALLDAAFDASPRELKRNAGPLAFLVVVLVVLTTAAVAFVGWRFGGLPIAAAIALGAIVAPPDAVAASAVLNQLRPPQRIMHLLQGESLFNDAVALLIFRLAVTAATAGFTLLSAAPVILLVLVGSVVAGYALARLYFAATRGVTDAASATVLQFVATFGVWILTENAGLSPIVTIVVYAMTLARSTARHTPARLRVSSYSVWETAVFVLNVLAFVLMGLQARALVQRVVEQGGLAALTLPLAVLATVVAVRVVWVLAYERATHLWRARRPQNGEDGGPDGLKGAVVVAWCGMRGLVTLAAAFALPQDFPGRDIIALSAFAVVLGTLVIQGLTLRPLLLRLGLEDDGAVEREVSLARTAIMRAALDTLDGKDSRAAQAVREFYAAAEDAARDITDPQRATEYDRLRLEAIAAQRERLDALRHDGDIGDEAFHRLQEEIDWSELDAAAPGSFQPLLSEGAAPRPEAAP